MSNFIRAILSLTFFATAVVFTNGCSTIAVLKNPPKVKLKDVRLKDTDFKTAVLDIILEVDNKNDVSAAVDRLSYSLTVSDKPLTQGTFDQKVELPANQIVEVAVPVTVQVQDIFSSALSLLQNNGAPYHVSGSVGVGIFDIPFDAHGKVDLKKH